MKLPNTLEELEKLLLEVLSKLFALEEDISKLRKENAELRVENTQLRMENAQLRAENAELRRRLGMNSGNSHKPPSSDGYKKKKIVATLPKYVGRVWQDNYMGLIWFVISHGAISLCIAKGGKRH